MNEVVLRAMSVGELLDKAFRIYRSKFLLLIAILAVALIPDSLIRLVAIFYFPGSFGSLLTSWAQILIRLIATVSLTVFISYTYLEKPITFQNAFSFGLKRYWSVFGANFLVGIMIGMPIAFVGACIVFTIGSAAVGLIILFLPLIVFFSAKWSMSMPAIVLENLGASDGLKRSWNLTDEYFWRVLGTSFAATLLTWLITLLPSYAFAYLFTMVNLDPKIVQLFSLMIEQVATLIASPFSIAATVLIYYDLRIRKEGFDLQVLAESSNEPIVSAE